MSQESREYTSEEVKEKFLNVAKGIVEEWATFPNKSEEERIRGAVFSMLAMIDGENAEMPGFILAPQPHPDDMNFHKERGKNYMPDNNNACVKADISGDLHDEFMKLMTKE